jgi:predicted kinase
MHRPRLLLVTGPPCSGKTSLATRLQRDLGLMVIAKDPLKECLFDALGTGDEDWSRRLSRAAFGVQLACAKSALEAGVDTLLEGNFTRAEHAGPVAALVATPAQAVQVACTAPVAVLEARQRRRAAGALRHPGHLDALRDPSARSRGGYAPLDIEPTLVFDSGTDAGPDYAALLVRLRAAGFGVARD